MPNPAVTYTFTNSTTADASQVNQNFTDIINGVTDATKDLSISVLTVAGTATLNGNVALGNASADDITITGSLASSIPIKTTFLYDFGSATIGLKSIYLGDSGSAARTTRIIGAAVASSWTLTTPTTTGTAGQFLQTNGSGVTTWANTAPTRQIFTTGSGTYTTAAGVLYLKVTTVGGGAAGGTGNGGGSTGGAGGGGGGGTAIKWITSPSATYAYVVGAAAGTSSFGSTVCSASGGTAGTNSDATVAGHPGGAGGAGTNGDILISGQGGSAGAPTISGTAYGSSGAGGSSTMGGGGKAVNSAVGAAGGNYGGGGSGASGASTTAGAGAGGIVVVEEFYH